MMRKTGLVLLMAAMAVSLAACSKKETKETTAALTEAVTTEAVTTEAATTEAATTEAATTEAATTEAAAAEAEPEADSQLLELLNQIYEKKAPEFFRGEFPVDLTDEYAVSSYTGLTLKEAEEIDAAVASEPMMSSQAYSLVLVRVKEGADTAALAQKMADGIDQRKWICVEASDLQVAAKDDIIMLIMVDPGLSLTSEDMVDAFGEICGEPDGTYRKK